MDHCQGAMSIARRRPGRVTAESAAAGGGAGRDTLRLAILHRVCTEYRLELFRRLSETNGLRVRLFIGEDLPKSKVRTNVDLSSLDFCKCRTTFIRLERRLIPVHRRLYQALRQFDPDVILCEGESHLYGCLTAIAYRSRHPQVGLVHWSLGGMPGAPHHGRSLSTRAKYALQRRFDTFLAYSSYGKQRLIALGHHPERIFVATNVSCVEKHLAIARTLPESRREARLKLRLPSRFTLIYAGSMDRNKRLGVLLKAAAALSENCNLLLVGAGTMLERLKAQAMHLRHTVCFPGRVGRELPWYYRASDVLVLPGRGGVVISEAMAYGVPVITHQADGTEYDLVRHGETGVLLPDGSPEALRCAIEFVRSDPDRAARWGRRAQELIEAKFTMGHMAKQIIAAVEAARRARRQPLCEPTW
ncbi:MAG TPA: glycosyltransferase family 1 protein [Planctomycetes bacterium]|nr:glycosyltransferase family 1 protein [Planctomycetota bacterium]